MIAAEYEYFKALIADLCTAYDRPCTDDRVRVFWECLKHLPLSEVTRSAGTFRKTSKKMATPADLIPAYRERPTAPGAPEPMMSTWAVAANKILFTLAYSDPRRGFVPMGKDVMEQCVFIKNDYVRMAIESEAAGEPWDTVEFNVMCREGFEKLLGLTSRAA